MTRAEWEERKNRNKRSIKVGDRVILTYTGPSPTGNMPTWLTFNLNKVFTVFKIAGDLAFVDADRVCNIARFDKVVRNNPKEKSLVYFNL